MAIINLQKRARELGRIRIGQVVPGNDGRTRPEKLDRFRLTSPSQPLLERVAALYGGTVEAWTPQNGGPAQWEVITTSTRLPVMVPPQPVSQFYELWSGGGCQRRCDGERELLTEKPCLCDPDPERRECKPTTRLNVVLRDVEGIGVWRLESHGYYSAIELPEVADFLARVGGYIDAYLSLEARSAKRWNEKKGKYETRHWMVPTLEVDITPTQLMSGVGANALGAGSAPAAIGNGGAPALPAAPAAVQDEPSTLAAVAAITDVADLRALYTDLNGRGALTGPIARALSARATELGATGTNAAAAPTPGADNPDALWQRVLAAAPDGWTSQKLEDEFEATVGVAAEKATATDMQTYLDVTAGAS